MKPTVTIPHREWIAREVPVAEIAIWWARAWWKAADKYERAAIQSRLSLLPWRSAAARAHELQRLRCSFRAWRAVRRKDAAKTQPSPTGGGEG